MQVLRVRSARWVAFAGMVAVVVCGCSSSSGDGTGDAPVSLQLPSGATQAFEIVDFSSFDAYSATVWRSQKRCAESRGFTVRENPVNDFSSALLQSPDTLGGRTPEQARLEGLKTGALASGPARVREAPGVDEALGQCLEKARELLGPEAEKVTSEFIALTNDLSAEFSEKFNPFIEKSLVAQRRCVVEKGFPVADENALEDPNVSPAQVFGVPTGTTRQGNGKDEYTPTPQEVDVALALSDCSTRLRSGEMLMTEAKKIQIDIVASYEQRINGVNERVKTLAARADTVLT